MSASDEEEKKFVIKHVFKDVNNLLMTREVGADMAGPVEEHHGVEWKLRLVKCKRNYIEFIQFYLDCVKAEQSCDWSIETELDVFANGENIALTCKSVFSGDCRSNYFLNFSEYDSTNDKMPVEFHVTIKNITGIEKKKLRNFDQKSAGKFSDVVLVVGGQKFYVLKKFLAMHSTYFESMFLGSFAESGKSEIELKDVNPEPFQHFLDLIHGESSVQEHTVEGILHLADFFGAKTATKRCHDFLLTNSKLSEKKKFELAVKCGFEDVKKKCLSDMKTKDDVKNVLPDEPTLLHQSVWAELVEKLCTLG